LYGYNNGVLALAFNPDGATLTSAGFDRTIRLWSAARRMALERLDGHTGAIYSLAFSPDGTLLVSGSGGNDRSIRLWSVARATQLFEQSIALRRALGETEGEANLPGSTALQARAAVQYGRATALLKDAVARHRALGDRGGIGSGGLGQSLYTLGLVLREQGDVAGATTMFEKCIAFHRALGNGEGIAVGLLALGDIARDQGDAVGVRRVVPAITLKDNVRSRSSATTGRRSNELFRRKRFTRWLH
jgi:hypothetical protein